jgi:RNA polymerase sigma factor (sigma-70 family)
VARSFGGGHDAAMDRFAAILEKLRDQDFRRLRAFHPGGTARFSTWVTVTARRICLDEIRARYGRAREPDTVGAEHDSRLVRRRLADHLFESLESVEVGGDDVPAPDAELLARERQGALMRAMDALPPRDRLILTLRFEDGLTALEIARTVGMPTPFHVFRHLNRSHAALRRALTAEGVDGD